MTTTTGMILPLGSTSTVGRFGTCANRLIPPLSPIGSSGQAVFRIPLDAEIRGLLAERHAQGDRRRGLLWVESEHWMRSILLLPPPQSLPRVGR